MYIRIGVLTISIIALIGYAFLFGDIIKKNFVFDGVFETEYDFNTESPFISLLKPRGRVDQEIKQDENGVYYQRLFIDPVYTDIEVPRSFDTLKVVLQYKNPYEQLFELGLSSGENSPNFTFKPIENKLIDNLIASDSWNILEEDGYLLFQKIPEYESIRDFLKSPPVHKKIAAYNVDLNYNYKIPTYQSPEVRSEIHTSLRGAHSFYTYVGKGEDLSIEFTFQDVNRVENSDEIDIRLEYYDREILTEHIDDDGVIDDSASMGAPFKKNIEIKQPPEGLYRVNIKSSDDIFIRDIVTDQKYITFIDHVYLADNVGYWNEHYPERYESTDIVTNIEKLRTITSHEEGFQEVHFGEHRTVVDQKHILFTVLNPLSTRNRYVDTIHVEHNDIKLIGNGLFAFSNDMFFDPLPFEVTGDPSVNIDNYGIDYLIAQYRPPVHEGDWYTQELTFDLTAIRDKDNKYRLAFSFPYSQRDETDIRLSRIALTYIGESINYNVFYQKIVNYIKRVLTI